MRKPGLLSFDMDAQLRWSGKGISLDVVDGQYIARKLIGSSGVLIGRVAPSVYAGKQLLKLCSGLHGLALLIHMVSVPQYTPPPAPVQVVYIAIKSTG